jgi:hypothetical protein
MQANYTYSGRQLERHYFSSTEKRGMHLKEGKHTKTANGVDDSYASGRSRPLQEGCWPDRHNCTSHLI